MRKIEIFCATSIMNLENSVNDFISRHNVVDIQFSSAADSSRVAHSVMIVYEED